MLFWENSLRGSTEMKEGKNTKILNFLCTFNEHLGVNESTTQRPKRCHLSVQQSPTSLSSN